jgi:hypothetical protein
MKITTSIHMGEKELFAENDLPDDVLNSPFLLALFVTNVHTGVRDGMAKQFRAMGYEVDME